mgnify:CR=1 FL=1
MHLGHELDYENVEVGPDTIKFCPVCGSQEIEYSGPYWGVDKDWQGYDVIHQFDCDCGGFEYTDCFRTRPESVPVERPKSDTYRDLARRANVLGLLLTKHDIGYRDVITQTPHHSVDLFVAQVGAMGDNRRALRELVRETDYLTVLPLNRGLEVEYQGLYTDLGLVHGELETCDREECSNTADQFKIIPKVELVRQYCDEHIEDAFESLTEA